MNKGLLVAFGLYLTLVVTSADSQAVAQAQPGASQSGRESLPVAFFIDSVEVAPFAREVGDPNGEYSGAVHVWFRVRNTASPTGSYVSLSPLYPPAAKQASGKNLSATLDLVAYAAPGTSDVCAFTEVESVFLFHSKIPVGVTRVRSANNVISLNGSGHKMAEFKPPDCAKALGSKVSNAAPGRFSGQGSAQMVRVIKASDSMSDVTVNPNRMSLFLDDFDSVSAVLWQ